MLSSRNSKLVILLACVAAVSGCADYLNRRDSITLGAGNSIEANTAIQTIDPFPDNASDTQIMITR